MKRILFILVALTVSSLGSFAQTTTTTTVADSIVFNSTVHDYGTIVQGSDGSFDFVFTNIGDVPVVLSNVQASCGCTVPTLAHEPIEPKKTGTIKVTYNTNNVGTFSKSITVSSNAKNGTVVLSIKGTVTAKPQ